MSERLARLADAGDAYRDPVDAVDWTADDLGLPWLPPELLNIAALGPLAKDPAWVVRLSRVEFARLCAAGLWLEGVFIGQLSRHGFLAAQPDATRIMLQEVREEAGHGLMFLRAIGAAGFGGVDLLGPTRLLTWVALRLHPGGVPFWTMTWLGEAVTDALAVMALKQPSALCPVARTVLRLHHRDEARHISAARTMIERGLAGFPPWRRALFPAVVRSLLRLFLDAVMYPTPASLAALGLPDPAAAAAAARACTKRRAVVEACVAPTMAGLSRLGLLPVR